MFLKNKLNQNQTGFASIVVAMTMIVVLALLTIAFAQLARREQQSSLDKQLAIQAYYAAESGINDAVKNIVTLPDSPNSCIDISSVIPGTSPNVNPSSGVSYSCMLINKHPKGVGLTDITDEHGQYSTYSSQSPIDTMKIQWDSGSTTFPALATKFPPVSKWHDASNNAYPAVVQFTLTPLQSSISRDSLINGSFTVYLYPAAGGPSTIVYDPANNGQIITGNCVTGNPKYPCEATITGLSNANYIFHISTFYSNSSSTDVYVAGSSGGTTQTITDQIIVDVTGKAHNVLKRLQVRLAANPDGTIKNPNIRPDKALQAQDICKRIQTQPGGSDYLDENSAKLNPASKSSCNLGN